MGLKVTPSELALCLWQVPSQPAMGFWDGGERAKWGLFVISHGPWWGPTPISFSRTWAAPTGLVILFGSQLSPVVFKHRQTQGFLQKLLE